MSPLPRYPVGPLLDSIHARIKSDYPSMTFYALGIPDLNTPPPYAGVISAIATWDPFKMVAAWLVSVAIQIVAQEIGPATVTDIMGKIILSAAQDLVISDDFEIEEVEIDPPRVALVMGTERGPFQQGDVVLKYLVRDLQSGPIAPFTIP